MPDHHTQADATPGKPGDEHLVILIHGIRTQGSWGEMVAAVLESTGPVKVIPIKYGYFDVFRFFCPVFTRSAPVQKILRELRHLRAEHPTAKISVIAHSFGTYAIMKALQEREIILHRLILCGSIIPESFHRAEFRSQLGPDAVLNDCGTHDIWPVLAKSITWGYGATGTFGLGTVGVRDRYSKLGHSDYFNKQFVTDFWSPYVHEGRIVPTEWERTRTTPPLWMSLLAWFPLKYLFTLLVCLGIGWAGMKVSSSGEASIKLGDDIIVGHWTGVPAYTQRVHFSNTTRKDATVTELRLTLTDPDGRKTAMQMESFMILGMGGQFPATDQWLIAPHQTPFNDYIFFNTGPGFMGLHTEIGGYLTSINANVNTPDESRELLTEALTKKAQDFAKAQFIWKPGTWTVTLTGKVGERRVQSVKTFSLSQEEVDRMLRIVDHYKSGIGILPNWRALSFGNYQPYLPKAADP